MLGRERPCSALVFLRLSVLGARRRLAQLQYARLGLALDEQPTILPLVLLRSSYRLPIPALTLWVLATACAATTPTRPPSTAGNVATPRQIDVPWMSTTDWRRRHEATLDAPHRERSRLLLVGDSIVEAWCGTEHFKRTFGEHQPLNLGIGGDQTQHVLWRLAHGAIDGTRPRAVVLLVGVNNLGHGQSPQQAVDGVTAIIRAIKQRLPQVPLTVLELFPAGATADDPLRRKIVRTNALLREVELPPGARLVDIGQRLLTPDGQIPPSVLYDALHPTTEAYTRLSTALEAVLRNDLESPTSSPAPPETPHESQPTPE